MRNAVELAKELATIDVPLRRAADRGRRRAAGTRPSSVTWAGRSLQAARRVPRRGDRDLAPSVGRRHGAVRGSLPLVRGGSLWAAPRPGRELTDLGRRPRRSRAAPRRQARQRLPLIRDAARTTTRRACRSSAPRHVRPGGRSRFFRRVPGRVRARRTGPMFMLDRRARADDRDLRAFADAGVSHVAVDFAETDPEKSRA